MISKKQKAILAYPYTDKDVLICDGAVRSGKTTFMMWAFIRWAMDNFDRMRFGICGKTVDSAAKNIIVPFISMTEAKKQYGLRWRRGEHILEVSYKGRKNFFEVFGGKDESSFMLFKAERLPVYFWTRSCSCRSHSSIRLWLVVLWTVRGFGFRATLLPPSIGFTQTGFRGWTTTTLSICTFQWTTIRRCLQKCWSATNRCTRAYSTSATF